LNICAKENNSILVAKNAHSLYSPCSCFSYKNKPGLLWGGHIFRGPYLDFDKVEVSLRRYGMQRCGWRDRNAPQSHFKLFLHELKWLNSTTSTCINSQHLKIKKGANYRV
jgi:hypothetical protein